MIVSRMEILNPDAWDSLLARCLQNSKIKHRKKVGKFKSNISVNQWHEFSHDLAPFASKLEQNGRIN